MPVRTNRFGRLHSMSNLRQLDVRITVVYQLIQIIHRLPNAHLPRLWRQIGLPNCSIEFHRLVDVILAIEFHHPIASVIVVIPKAVLVVLRIPLTNVVVPFVDIVQGLSWLHFRTR